MTQMFCVCCGNKLEYNDIGAHKKFINRGSKEFMCIKCLAKEFGVSEKLINDKIEYFKNIGCTLFI